MAAEPWTCDFTQPLDARYWTPTILGSFDFTYTTTATGLHVSSADGGSGFQSARLLLNLDNFAGGLTDFDAVVTFDGAVFSEYWRHQVQMEFGFSSQYIAVVKDQSNIHVWRDPPASQVNTTTTYATAGTMRVIRSGASISAYWDNSPTPFWSETYGTTPISYFSLALNKNSTSAATTVTWKTFSITPSPVIAPLVTPAPRVTSTAFYNGSFTLSWSSAAGTPVNVERSNTLTNTIWDVVSPGNTSGSFTDTSPLPDRGFYRIAYPLAQ
jgi:hypothetical protein